MFDKNPLTSTAKYHCQDSFEIYDWTYFITHRLVDPAFIFHCDYSLIWIEQGEVAVSIDSQPCYIRAGSLCCVRRGQKISCSSHGQVKGYVISFGVGFLDLHDKRSTALIQESLFNHLLVTPILPLPEGCNLFMQELAPKMLDEFAGHSAYRTEMLKGFLKVFIIYTGRAIQKLAPPFNQSKKTALVMRFYTLLETYFASKRMVRDYAAMLQVSAGYLNDAVREVSGMAASYHIQQRVVREAKRQLFFEGSSMKEIAFSLGFCDQAHFSKYFKNISGKNFTDFKKDTTS